MNNLNKKGYDVNQRLSDAGIRLTPNRVLVARALMNGNGPMSLADIEMSIGSLDKSSVFRVLMLFVKRELVHVVDDGSSAAKYELCVSAGGHSIEDLHPHFHCEKCGETFCLEDVHVPTIDVPDGFVARSVNYVVRGLCRKCATRLH